MADQKDDFAAAFEQFSAPEEKAPAADTKTAEASAAATDGGTTDGAGSGDGAVGDGGSGGAAADPGADGGASAGSGDGAAAADDKGGAAPAADDKGAAAPAADDKGGAAPAADAGAAAAEPASGGDASAPNADDVLARLSKLVADAKPAAEAPAGEAKEEPKPPYTDDEAAALQQYEKDWPDVAKNEALRRRGEYQEMLGFIFTEVQKYVQPLMETLDALAGRAHLADVKAAVPDYSDNLRQQVVDWVAKQPAYLQTAYNHVIQNGTHDEVKDLVERYRQATGRAAPAAGAASTGGQAQSQPKDNELSDAAKEAAAALAPVESKRSEVINSGDPSSFEDAWSQFAKDIA